MNLKQIGIILIVIAIATIIISQTILFTTTTSSNAGFGLREVNVRENTSLKNVILIAGIVLFIAGGFTLASDIEANSSNNNGIMGKTQPEKQTDSETPTVNDLRCSKCGKEFSSNMKGKFCQKCGNKL